MTSVDAVRKSIPNPIMKCVLKILWGCIADHAFDMGSWGLMYQDLLNAKVFAECHNRQFRDVGLKRYIHTMEISYLIVQFC